MHKINGHNIVLSSEVEILLAQYDETAYSPPKNEIFAALNLCGFSDTKVVLVGQDPYPTPGDAMGLSFSVNDGVKIPKSLVNIFKELENDLGIARTNGNLKDIATQGVLFLNISLTVENYKPLSHSKIGWDKTTFKIIEDLSSRGKVIFVLLGKEAQKLETLIDVDLNTIIKTSHPSPLGAYRGFNGSKIFSEIENACNKYSYTTIRW